MRVEDRLRRSADRDDLPDPRSVVAVDVGGTTTKAALVGADGRAVLTSTTVTGSGDAAVTAVADAVRGLTEAADDLGRRVVAAGVVTPGLLDERTGVVAYASNLGWRDVPLRDRLTDALGIPVATGHDVRAAGLAEQLFGAARGYADVVLVPIGTGIAASLTSAGAAVAGATGGSGELGHIPVVADGEPCTCGQRGCLEVYVSGAGLARRYAARTGRALRAEQVVDLVGADPDADAVWADAVRALAQGLVTVTLLLDPAVVVLGGGFLASGDRLLTPVRAALDAGLAWRAAPPVRVAELGAHGGRIGASVLAFRHAGHGDVPAAWDAAALVGRGAAAVAGA
ncbi:ROK family protein [Cellulomonas hominis]|uniref:ROK family protein n=1 Tax=Cellulomonas hominis TaxID=156981 RepID=UPI001B9B67E3|nr:ROK family protein [Cellulomonas hominis]VTR76867.1 Glucokinase [Cellulomonas hominis]